MNTNLLAIVKQIVTEQGDSILGDPRRVAAFFADLARDIPKPQKNAFIKCLEHNFAQIFKNADASNREACKQQLAKRLEEDEGFNPVLCGETIELLAAVLFGEKKKEEKKVYCKNCGKELQKEWKTCPYCSVQAAGTSPPVGSVAPSVTPSTATQLQQADINMEMVLIPGGTFTMGSPTNELGRFSDEGPLHQVTLTKAFYMGKYEVTQKEYREIMGTNPSISKGKNLPVEWVSWYDAVEYCNRRSQRERLTLAYTINGKNVTWNRNANGYRLPTEAEWEYACRAGTTTAYNTGANISDNTGWYDANSYNTTHPVGKKPANHWGLHDMHGNVWEWCWDWYENYYSGGAQTDPSGAVSGTYRVLRGGSWIHSAVDVRSACRLSYYPDYGGDSFGFRLVRNEQ